MTLASPTFPFFFFPPSNFYGSCCLCFFTFTPRAMAWLLRRCIHPFSARFLSLSVLCVLPSRTSINALYRPQGDSTFNNSSSALDLVYADCVFYVFLSHLLRQFPICRSIYLVPDALLSWKFLFSLVPYRVYAYLLCFFFFSCP